MGDISVAVKGVRCSSISIHARQTSNNS